MKVLGLVFTQGVSLEIWVKTGLITREKQIYEEHLSKGHFNRIIWFTYGKNDKKIREELISKGQLDKRIEVVEMPKVCRSVFFYSVFLPFIRRKYCKEIDVIKTNQMQGAWTAAFIKGVYKIPFILRTGYTYTNLLKNKVIKEANIFKRFKLYCQYKKYRMIEMCMYKQCDVATVSSMHDKEYICDSYQIQSTKVNIVKNYIDCDLFWPMNNTEKKERFIFVGRLSHEKNLFHIIEALGKLRIGLDIYGKGELQEELEEYIEKNRYDVYLKGTVDNGQLPEIYNMYQYYILASPFEGMPKTLLEAMACGCVCIGTNTSGIKEVIKHKENGYLIEETSSQSIIKAVKEIDMMKNKKISEAAVQYIREKHSLQTICNEEWKMIKQLF